MPKLPSGSVFKRRYRDSGGKMTEAKLWTIKYYLDGKPKQEPAETEDYDEAVAFLRRRMAENAVATVHASYPERVTMDQLFDLLVQDYTLQKRRSLYDAEKRINARLRPYFGEMKAQGVGTATLRQYIQHRRHEQAQDATINRELALVRRALNLGAQERPPLVLNVPHFPMLLVDNARQGTLDHEPYRLIRDALPFYARIVISDRLSHRRAPRRNF